MNTGITADTTTEPTRMTADAFVAWAIGLPNELRYVTWHRRGAGGAFGASEHGDEAFTFDPPGITIDRLFP